MTPEEIDASDDVGELYAQLQAAKAFGNEPRVRLLQRRMRDLAGQNTKSDDRRGKSVAADPAAIARIRSDGEAGGGA